MKDTFTLNITKTNSLLGTLFEATQTPLNEEDDVPPISMNANASLNSSILTQMDEETENEHNALNVDKDTSSISGNVSVSPLMDAGPANDYESPNLDGNLDDLISVVLKFSQNVSFGYINVNSLRNAKFDQIKEMCRLCPLDILCLDESKLTDDFPTSQFHIDGYYYPPFRRDRPSKSVRSFGGGKLVFAKDGLIVKRLTELETPTAETICLELQISKRKWFIVFAYRPESINRTLFFDEIKKTLNLAINKYDNIILAGDLNVDMDIPEKDVKGYLSDLCDTFDFTNLINQKTCLQSENGSSLDVILTNRPRSFQMTSVIETGISDHHKLTTTFFRSHFQRLPPKNIIYRDCKIFDENQFLRDINDAPIKETLLTDPRNAYENFTTIFRNLIDIHAPLKKKKIRGNQAPFMTKEYSKAIMTRSRIKNRYNKWKSRENYLEYQKAKNNCKKIGALAKRNYFTKVTENGIMSSKELWKVVKPYLNKNACISGGSIILEEKGKIISKEEDLVEIFNDHYINIVTNTTGKVPTSLGDPSNPSLDKCTVEEIIEKYREHPCIEKIRNSGQTQLNSFTLPLAKREEINDIIKSLDISKSTGPDQIPPKFVKIAADIIDEHLTNIINFDIKRNSFPENAKTAYISTIYKKLKRLDKVNYRPVSILNTFSKIHEKYIKEKITPFVDECLSIFISAYRKKYSSSHVLIRLIENWKKHLDKGKFVGAVLMDLSKAFDCVPHDLLIAKMHAYGFDIDSLTFFYSYLKRRNQSVKINNIHGMFQVLLSGVPQGSILGPILFNIFINDIFLWIENSELENFADDNTISVFADSISELINILESESEVAIDWFSLNELIANPDKFHAIIINRCGRYKHTHTLKVAGKNIESETSVPLLGVEIDYKLNFNKHIGNLCKRAAGQLNGICRMNKSIGFKEKHVLIQSFIFSNFNYCPLVWMNCSNESMRKIERIQERSLRLLYNDYESDYDSLLHKAEIPRMEIKRLRTLAIEVFKTLNDLNPTYMKEIFVKNRQYSNYPNNLNTHMHTGVTYGEKSLSYLAPKIWNSLPEHFKLDRSFSSFKKLIKTWTWDFKCGCSACTYENKT